MSNSLTYDYGNPDIINVKNYDYDTYMPNYIILKNDDNHIITSK